MKLRGFRVAVESNGALPAPEGIAWLCVSPKAVAPLAQVSGQELKLAYPQDGLDPAAFLTLDFTHFFLQPMDGPERDRNAALAVAYCLAHPPWRISVQTHKLMDIP